VLAGSIAHCVGNLNAAPRWQWRCGFYPDSKPGECTNGTAANFDEARADFETAWRVFVAKRTEVDFKAWRDQWDWTAEKYRRFDRGERMPPDWRHLALQLPFPFEVSAASGGLVSSPP
jgi:hypothetical protein